ncbi:MAG: acyl-CoA/acyl-ACP dehydrogenase [Proteobacteria bacterium]|nr:acyl-CoA/acyl-ACP dehydrogenase [Pseudomonadota bacterium]
MDFALSEEQMLLAKTLERYLEEECPITRVRELVAERAGHDGGTWKDLSELGVAGILVPEEHGGSGLTLLDSAATAESLARGVAPVPFLGSAVMAPIALAAAGSREQQARWLPLLATGDCRVGVAATELVSTRDGAGVEERSGCLHGTALMVIDGPGADHFLVPLAGGERLAWVDAQAPGLSTTRLKTIDRTRGFAELELDGVKVEEWLGEGGAARDATRRMLTAGRAVLAADLLGACARAIELAVAYAGQREQFGRVIASFQAVKHLCAEMVAELEPARSLVWYAAYAFDAVPADAEKMACHAKAHLSEIGPFIVRTAIEVHGGVGFTDEQNLHYWFKRVGVDRQLLGHPDSLREEAARLQGWVD